MTKEEFLVIFTFFNLAFNSVRQVANLGENSIIGKNDSCAPPANKGSPYSTSAPHNLNIILLLTYISASHDPALSPLNPFFITLFPVIKSFLRVVKQYPLGTSVNSTRSQFVSNFG